MSRNKIENKNIEYLEKHADKILNKVSKNVIKYRKEKGFSQTSLAKAIGYKSAAYLGKAEIRKSKQHFNISQIAKISKVLDIEITDLFK